MKLHGCDTDEPNGPNDFLPYGQPGIIIDTTKHKKRLQAMAVPAKYFKCVSNDTYQVYEMDKKCITTIRHSEFVLKGIIDVNNEDPKDKPSAVEAVSKPVGE